MVSGPSFTSYFGSAATPPTPGLGQHLPPPQVFPPCYGSLTTPSPSGVMETSNPANTLVSIVVTTQYFERLLDRFRRGFEPFKEVARKMGKTLWGLRGLRAQECVCVLFEEGEAQQQAEGDRDWMVQRRYGWGLAIKRGLGN